MARHRITPPWDYLHQASDPSLESFELSRLNHAANLRKEVAALLEQWIEEAAEALLARWVREDRQSAAEPGQPLDLFPQVPQSQPSFSTPQTIDLRSRQPDRRLRSRRPPSSA